MQCLLNFAPFFHQDLYSTSLPFSLLFSFSFLPCFMVLVLKIGDLLEISGDLQARSFYFPFPENTLPIFRTDMKGYFLHGVLQETEKRGKRLLQKFTLSVCVLKKKIVILFAVYCSKLWKIYPTKCSGALKASELHTAPAGRLAFHMHTRMCTWTFVHTKKYACSHTHKQAEN